MAKAACRSGVCLLAAVALAEGAFLAGNFLLMVAAAFALIAVSGFLGYGILDAWQQRRSRGQLPPGPNQGHRAPEGRRRGDGVAPGGISPMRADRTRADQTRADSRAWRPGRDHGHPSRRRIPVPVRPLPNAACDAGCLS
jgi:hypothetical protein